MKSIIKKGSLMVLMFAFAVPVFADYDTSLMVPRVPGYQSEQPQVVYQQGPQLSRDATEFLQKMWEKGYLADQKIRLDTMAAFSQAKTEAELKFNLEKLALYHGLELEEARGEAEIRKQEFQEYKKFIKNDPYAIKSRNARFRDMETGKNISSRRELNNYRQYDKYVEASQQRYSITSVPDERLTYQTEMINEDFQKQMEGYIEYNKAYQTWAAKNDYEMIQSKKQNSFWNRMERKYFPEYLGN